MECFNCNEKATTKLSIEPEFGEIYTCDSDTCKAKAKADIDRFSRIKYQGRRKDQVEFAERMIAYAILGILVITIVATLSSIIDRL